jgi:hypothetical protein
MMPADRRQIFAVVFAVVFPLVYVIAVDKNWAMFTYHPLSYELGLGAQEPRDGPAMYWFGWLATATIAAGFTALLASLLPRALTRIFCPALAWAVPLAVLIAFSVLLRDYFLR